MSFIEKAKSFALDKHKDMYRDNKGQQPISYHLEEVATMTAQHIKCEHCIAAAWLHDTVEDTDTTLEDIQNMFGKKVRTLVEGLTDPDEWEQLPLHIRKPQQAERLKTKTNEIKLIKICDQISNVRIVNDDPPLGWSNVQSRDYIDGAHAIAKVCAGIAEDLDALFSSLYEEGCNKYPR